jgi:hypothetical protein
MQQRYVGSELPANVSERSLTCVLLTAVSLWLDGSPLEVDWPLKVGQAVGVFGTLLGWPLFLVLSSLIFIRFPRQQRLLHQILPWICLVMLILTMLLLIGMASEVCHSSAGSVETSCMPRAVYAIIPAVAGFATISLVQFFGDKHRPISDQKPRM